MSLPSLNVSHPRLDAQGSLDRLRRGLLRAAVSNRSCTSPFQVGAAALIAGTFPLTSGEAFRAIGARRSSQLAHLDGVFLLQLGCGFMQSSGPIVGRRGAHVHRHGVASTWRQQVTAVHHRLFG